MNYKIFYYHDWNYYYLWGTELATSRSQASTYRAHSNCLLTSPNNLLSVALGHNAITFTPVRSTWYWCYGKRQQYQTDSHDFQSYKLDPKIYDDFYTKSLYTGYFWTSILEILLETFSKKGFELIEITT